MLQNFYDTAELKNITGSTSFEKVFALDLPQMKVEYEKRSMYAQREGEYVVDLAKTAKLMKEDKVPYYSPVDYLMETSLHGFTKTSKSMVAVLQAVMVLATVLALIVSFCAYCKVKTLQGRFQHLTPLPQEASSEEAAPRRRRRKKTTHTDSEMEA